MPSDPWDLLAGVLSDLRYRLRAVFRRAAVERELAEELELHLELEAEKLRRAGLPPDEARRRARLAFGGVERAKELSRDARGVRAAEQLGRDLAQALRLARRQPGFTAVVVLSLALGLGATTAVHNVAYNILLAPLPVPHAEQLVALTRRDDAGGRDDAFTGDELRAVRAAPGVGRFAAYRYASAVAIGVGDGRESINLQLVDREFFSLVGPGALRGRLLGPADDDARQAPAVVLSERLARRLFPLGPDSAVGRTVEVRGVPFTVVGITPRAFRGVDFPGGFSAAVSQSAAALIGLPDNGFSMGARDAYVVVGRLAVGRETAAAALAAALARCCATERAERRGAPARERLEVMDIRRGLPSQKLDLRGESRAMLVMLLSGMALVLVVVCCNIAGLLLVRGSARQREIAVRLALGASRRRLVGQLVLESVPAAIAGGVGGVLLAAWCTAALVRQLPPDWEELGELARFRVGAATLAFASAATVLCALGFAVYPALRATGRVAADALRGGPRASRTRAQGAVARGAVAAQMAITVVLVTATALLAATLDNLSRADGGFVTERVLLAGLETRSTPYERTGALPLADEVGRRVRAVPGVRQAVLATQLPLHGGTNAFTRLGAPGGGGGGGAAPTVRYVGVEPGYFAASGIRLLAGRDFAAADGARGEPVAVVSAAFARQHFGGRDPLGRTIALGEGEGAEPAVRIVGLAAGAKYFDLRTPADPVLYRPLAQLRGTWRTVQLWVRTDGDPAAVAPAVRRAVEAAAPGLRPLRMRDMASQRDAAVAPERLAARLATFVSAMALVLAAVGLYGVVAYGVQRRTTEIGVRLALGARAPAVVWLVARETLLLVGLGVLAGGALSLGTTSAMASQLFGVGAHDPRAAAAAMLVLTAVALAASIAPACRAVHIEPRIALGAE